MILLADALAAWDGADFSNVLKRSVEQLDPAALPLQQGLSMGSVAVADGQYSRELQGTSLSMAQRFIGGDEVIGRLRGGDRCFVLPRGLGIPVATEPRGHASRTAQCQQVSAHTRTGA